MAGKDEEERDGGEFDLFWCDKMSIAAVGAIDMSLESRSQMIFPLVHKIDYIGGRDSYPKDKTRNQTVGVGPIGFMMKVVGLSKDPVR